MKKSLFTAIFLFCFIFLGGTNLVHSETDANIEELSSQQTRLEEMKTLVNSFFALAEESDQQEIIESALNEAISRIDSIQERVENRIEERERKIEVMETINDWQELAEVFLEEPTLDNFDYFCKRSKEVDGPETKEVLNDDKTEMITISKTLYETVRPCQFYKEKEHQENYIFVNSSSNHKAQFDQKDSDEVRKLKIIFNEEVEKLSKKYEFYGFSNYHFNEDSPGTYFEKFLELPKARVSIREVETFFSVPEKYLSEMIKREEERIETDNEIQKLEEFLEGLSR
jgi:hypothetical protein